MRWDGTTTKRSLLRLTVYLGAGVALQSLLAGCAAKQPQQVRLVWPPAPQVSRIEFVRSIASDEDLEHDTTFSQRIINFLAGEKPPPNHIIEPMGLAVSDDGSVLYVSDVATLEVFVFDFGHKKFNKIDSLALPTGLALDGAQNLYVVEQETKKISVFDPALKRVRTISDPSLSRPNGIAIDRQRAKIYVCDTGLLKSKDHNIKIFSLDGKLLGTIGSGRGQGPGQFYYPTYVTLDGDGNLYVSDSMNARIQMFDPNGKYIRSFGERGDAWGMFEMPKGVALDSFGNLYAADAGWSNVQIFNHNGQVLLFFGGRGGIPGMLKNPSAVVIDKNNFIYVADFLNHRVEQYQLVHTTGADSFVDSHLSAQGGA